MAVFFYVALAAWEAAKFAVRSEVLGDFNFGHVLLVVALRRIGTGVEAESQRKVCVCVCV